MEVEKIRHAWPESRGFYLDRPNGCDEYVLLHFWQPMDLLIGSAQVHTRPYAFIIYDIHTPQRLSNPREDIVHDWIHITGNLKEILLRFNLRCDTVYYPQNSRFVTDIIREMETEFFSKGLNYKEILDIKLCELLAKTSRRIFQNGAKKVDKATEKALTELRQKVFSSLQCDIDVPQMAKSVNMSESRFFAVYKSLFGTTPAKDLIDARIQRAKFLLSKKEYSVSEVSKLSGYASEYHFIRQFKKLTGVTPGKYIP